MKVTRYAFEVGATCPAVPLNILFDEMSLSSGKSDNSKKPERRIYLDTKTNSDYYLGLVVTVKNQKRFCKLEDDKGNIKITVENLKGKEKLMEFNFFALNKNNGIGIYQHYHQSCSLGVFGSYLKSKYQQILKRKTKEEIELYEAKNGEISNRKKIKINKSYKGRLDFSQLVREDDLAKILKDNLDIKALEYEVSTLEPDEKKGIPLGRYVKKRREKLTFEEKWTVAELAQIIPNAIKKLGAEKTSVHVVNMNDDEQIINVFKIPRNFGVEDYDDVTQKLNNLDVKNFATHKVVKELIDICQSTEYKGIFEAQIK